VDEAALIWAKISLLAGEFCQGVVGEGAKENVEDLLLALLWLMQSGHVQDQSQEHRLLPLSHRLTRLLK
jgi:hypothetical protein